MAIDRNLIIEDAKIMFPNFAGKEGTYNAEGDRNFCVALPPDIAEKAKEDGWNVKVLRPLEDDVDPLAYLQVSVKFNVRPPKIVMISSTGKSQINEDSVAILDWAEIKKADMVIRPYNWEVGGRHGTKAYLKALYITIEEDELASKYEAVPDSSKGCVGGCGNCDVCDGGCHES